jgi:hypothetical protein
MQRKTTINPCHNSDMDKKPSEKCKKAELWAGE